MKLRYSLVLFAAGITLLAGCGPQAPGEAGTEIVSAGDAIELMDAANVVLVDARPAIDYRNGTLAGSVSISRADIVVNSPFTNMLAPPQQIETVMGSRGIGNDSLVLIYDDNQNMDAARLWWTLKVYGHGDVKVVSGGLTALQREGLEFVTTQPGVQPATFTAAPLDETMIATQKDVRDQVNDPDPATVIVDTRSQEEFDEGTIPGAVCLNFVDNNFSDGTYKPVQHIRIRYIEAGINYDNSAILFCKTSIRGAQSYLALYNAGYRDLKLYDAAWVEWSTNPMNPVYVPDPEVLLLEASDNS